MALICPVEESILKMDKMEIKILSNQVVQAPKSQVEESILKMDKMEIKTQSNQVVQAPIFPVEESIQFWKNLLLLFPFFYL